MNFVVYVTRARQIVLCFSTCLECYCCIIFVFLFYFICWLSLQCVIYFISKYNIQDICNHYSHKYGTFHFFFIFFILCNTTLYGFQVNNKIVFLMNYWHTYIHIIYPKQRLFLFDVSRMQNKHYFNNTIQCLSKHFIGTRLIFKCKLG